MKPLSFGLVDSNEETYAIVTFIENDDRTTLCMAAYLFDQRSGELYTNPVSAWRVAFPRAFVHNKFLASKLTIDAIASGALTVYDMRDKLYHYDELKSMKGPIPIKGLCK